MAKTNQAQLLDALSVENGNDAKTGRALMVLARNWKAY
jgi:hypothetical protein